jgi:acyl-CoA dehydrogenase
VNELEQLVDELGRRSFESKLGRRGFPDTFDDELWGRLEETGLSRLTGAQEAGPAEAAIVLNGLARHAAAVPIAETDLLATWLAHTADLTVPASGAMTVAIGDGQMRDRRLTGTARAVPWPRAGTVVVAARTADALHVGVLDKPAVDETHNLAGEPRGTIAFDIPVEIVRTLDPAVGEELIRRGAWARCVQIVGALDAARDLTVAHTSEREQFGRALAKFQAVQHSLAAMAGEVERARAATALATAAATDHGFDSAATDYAVTVAKVAVGRAVTAVTTIAHQLHGAIGVTVEHRLWLVTMRARSWADEFGTTAHHARRLGRMALASDDPWEFVVSCPAPR